MLKFVFYLLEKPFTLQQLAKISVRKILNCHYETLNSYYLPLNLKVYLMQNSAYFCV